MKLAAIALAGSCTVLAAHGCDLRSQQNPTQITPQTPTAAIPTQSSQAQTQNVSGRAIWNGMSDGFGIRWTKDDLFVQSASGLERIWAPLAKRGFDEFAADMNRVGQTEGGRTNNCDYQRDFEVLSIVGALVSFQDDEYSDCGGAHPTTERRFTMVDLTSPGQVFYGHGENAMDADFKKPGKVVKLTDYFTESDILNALLADHVIKQALADAGVSSPPRTLAGLSEVFSRNDYILSGTELVIRPDFLTRFAFHHIEGDMLAVRLNLPSIAFAYRSQQIGLLLPIPQSLQQSLALAAAGREGFLMREASPIVHNQFTRFKFKIGEGAKH
jgi:hypothetical protein